MTLQTSNDRLAHICQRMAVITLIFAITILVFNAIIWLFPKLGSIDGGYGLSFSLTNDLLSNPDIDTSSLVWWQTLGAIILTSLPLLALTSGLVALYQLFRSYSQQEYFSTAAASYMGKISHAVILWVILSFLCEPLLGMWLTLLEPSGERLITLSFTSGDITALFLAACIAAIARILHRASEINLENQNFV